MPTHVTITTPSRLHFGLLRFDERDGPSFGGMGMMIDHPCWVIELEHATHWTADGPQSDRALALARHTLAACGLALPVPALHIRIHAVIPPHRGLGGGTQLALAIAAGIRTLLGMPSASAAELAALTGRGQRSAVGTHGFHHGGLIWETGRLPGEELGQLAARVALPEHWRIVLIAAPERAGLSGPAERDAFAKLPPVPASTAAHLQDLAEQQILPAARRGAVEDFGEAVYQYGRIAGECFAPVQGAAYASPAIAQCVRAVRELGVPGVGQSSWGPTVYALTGNQEQAEWLADLLARDERWANDEIGITRPDNHGASFKVESRESSV